MIRNRLSVFPATPAYVNYTDGGGAYTRTEDKLAPAPCSATTSTNSITNFPAKLQSFTRFHVFPFITLIFAALIFMVASTAWGLEGIAINASNFPDANFRAHLSQYDTGWNQPDSDGNYHWIGAGDDFLDVTYEIPRVTGMTVYSVESLQGIAHFTALEVLGCHGSLKELDVSALGNLGLLNCDDNQLKTLDLSKNLRLYHLHCLNNQLEGLDVSSNKALQDLTCENNPLGVLDVSKNTELEILCCSSTDIRKLDVSKNEKLTRLQCWGNKLTELDLSNNKALTQVLLGVQEADGLKVKATLEGYEVCLKDYVSNLENIDISKVGANNYSARLLSYDGLTGNVVFDECPKVLHYDYRTHSPNNDLLHVQVKATMNVDVIERGGPTDNIIWGISENSYLDVTDNPIREDSIAGYSAKQYGKKGFVADGNSRLIVRVQTQRPGSVTFSVQENIGVEVESLRNRAKLTASTPVPTSSIGRDGYQASAVLVAPEMYPQFRRFPSSDFTVHVKFTADDTEEVSDEEKELEQDIKLELHAAPVLLVHGFGRNANVVNTFKGENGCGVLPVLQEEKFDVYGYKYDGTASPSEILFKKDSLFDYIAYIFSEYIVMREIVCTKTDVVAYDMGGLLVRLFCLPETYLSDGNYYTARSYGQGMIRRFVSIAVPHKGTPWANCIRGDFSVLKPEGIFELSSAGYFELYMLMRKIASLFNFNSNELTQKAREEMSVGSHIVTGSYPINVPMFAIYGEAGAFWRIFSQTIEVLADNIRFLWRAGINQINAKYLHDRLKALNLPNTERILSKLEETGTWNN